MLHYVGQKSENIRPLVRYEVSFLDFPFYRTYQDSARCETRHDQVQAEWFRDRMIRMRAVSIVMCAIMTTCVSCAPRPVVKQSLRAVPRLVSQRYCYGDAEVFSVLLKLNMRYENWSKEAAILDKEIGKAWYRIAVARDFNNLAAYRYEYHPIIDWFFTDEERPVEPDSDSPGSEFAILKPGQTFENEINTAVIAQYENLQNFPGSIRSGVHVLQMELSAWNHPGAPDYYAASWRDRGQLVTGLIKTEPLQIQVPSNPKVEADCK
jgi:hypothetical protein